MILTEIDKPINVFMLWLIFKFYTILSKESKNKTQKISNFKCYK